MSKIIKPAQLKVRKKSRKMLYGHITAFTLIFTASEVTPAISTQIVMVMTGLWSILLLCIMILKSKALHSYIANRNYLSYKLNNNESSKLLKFLDVAFILFVKYAELWVLKIFFKIEIRNTHLIPKKGAVIVASNHTSHIDSMILQATFPRRIIFTMLMKNYEKTWGKWFYHSLHAIPVKSHGINYQAIKEGLKLLKTNGTLCMFPEGKYTLDGKLLEGKDGVSFLARKSKATIVPAYITGAIGVFQPGIIFPRFQKICITYGDPIYYDEDHTNKTGQQEEVTDKIMTDKIMRELQLLSENPTWGKHRIKRDLSY